MDNNKRCNIVIWNNRHVLIEGKSVFYHSLFNKGIITLWRQSQFKLRTHMQQDLRDTEKIWMENPAC